MQSFSSNGSSAELLGCKGCICLWSTVQYHGELCHEVPQIEVQCLVALCAFCICCKQIGFGITIVCTLIGSNNSIGGSFTPCRVVCCSIESIKSATISRQIIPETWRICTPCIVAVCIIRTYTTFYRTIPKGKCSRIRGTFYRTCFGVIFNRCAELYTVTIITIYCFIVAA